MFETPINQKTINLKLKRIEACDLLLACAAISEALVKDGQNAKKWDTLHDKLKTIIDEFDKKQGF